MHVSGFAPSTKQIKVGRLDRSYFFKKVLDRGKQKVKGLLSCDFIGIAVQEILVAGHLGRQAGKANNFPGYAIRSKRSGKKLG